MNPQARGYKSRIALDFEQAFRTPPDIPGAVVVPINGYSVRGSRAKNNADTITGTRNPVMPFDGNLDVSGQVTVPVDSCAFWYWLTAAFGAPETTGTGPYTHTFTVGDTQPSMILENRFATTPVSYAACAGCKVGSLSISVGGDGELTAGLDIMGATEEFSPSPYQADPTPLSLKRLNNFQASVKEGGQVLGIGTAMNFDINFNLDGDGYVIGGGGVRGDIPEGLLSISGSMTCLFTDMTLLNKAMTSEETSLEITFDGGADSRLTFAFNEVQFSRQTPGVDGPQGIRLELPWQAYLDDHAGGSALVVTLTNNDAHEVL